MVQIYYEKWLDLVVKNVYEGQLHFHGRIYFEVIVYNDFYLSFQVSFVGDEEEKKGFHALKSLLKVVLL